MQGKIIRTGKANHALPLIHITKSFNFEMAHALMDYEGPCKNIHGHSYKLSVTVSGPLQTKGSAAGMVMDFKLLKQILKGKIINDFDHALVLNQEVPVEVINAVKSISPKLVLLPFNPTCENLLLEFRRRINTGFPKGIKLVSMHLRETETSYAEFFEPPQ